MDAAKISILIKKTSLAAVTGLVHKLEAKDLVKRMPHPQDKRRKVLALTDRAIAMKTAA